MKKKIVMKVQMNCEKCRTKAMKAAAGVEGVDSVAIEGNEKETVVVVGEGVDPVVLVELMRKKVGYTELVSVGEAKKEEVKKAAEASKTSMITYECCNQGVWYPGPKYIACETVYDHNPSICTIM
ncbi:hypothetical protein H6P81_008736 [Aristolochia fimbriata]|uniref:HMA domain-containing protein n=1 Tax=Aristolochia fimbriata TaxID=158543 RepID=A0AAV7EM72_ARIFI|nr:hypothetical protein H6P81_008736 [Aristolochia fimbriata]